MTALHDASTSSSKSTKTFSLRVLLIGHVRYEIFDKTNI